MTKTKERNKDIKAHMNDRVVVTRTCERHLCAQVPKRSGELIWQTHARRSVRRLPTRPGVTATDSSPLCSGGNAGGRNRSFCKSKKRERESKIRSACSGLRGLARAVEIVGKSGLGASGDEDEGLWVWSLWTCLI